MSFPLYFDEDSHEAALIVALRSDGFDVLCATDANMLRRTDEEQLAFASREGRAIVTSNASDFCRLHAAILGSGGTHAGIVIVMHGLSIGERLRRLEKMQTLAAEEMKNRLEYLSNW